ncbi:Heme chaperone--apocytochrome heme-lyase CcmE [Granulibacter bethesdensis CGDNIH1]|uniref:Cytochrome c-type biogenesis protein CcmE n=2 Tax=Granulibacter bethesdensis TaxID=364410 RepID=Q0BVI4_GRABC|nr:Heme chaperone--apocytochrome heme-lyase CcmE [Granulibacter bethesdensis CGDNIH1]APH50944.1 Heme chaperone--apocytochrome heme-lyase CcmE [Granulibacter bethesdensis]APH63639.1 Heme chaperone--apocytochrome heme-lyase CcmE [Granulibacter bethesdensis]
MRNRLQEILIMTRKRRRLYILLACGIGLGSATALTLFAFSDNLVFFMAPSDFANNHVAAGRTIRLGGLVQAGSVHREVENGQPAAKFVVTDGKASVPVTFTGILPDLFREGQGVVALGTVEPDGSFHASEVLAKHDETYMPKDVAEALKKSGRWNPASGPPPAASTWYRMNPASTADLQKNRTGG